MAILGATRHKVASKEKAVSLFRRPGRLRSIGGGCGKANLAQLPLPLVLFGTENNDQL